MAATGNAWLTDNAGRSYCLFDKDSKLDFPFDWADWLEEEGSTYGSHTITCEAPLECTASAQLAGVIVARIKVQDGESVVNGKKYYVLCHIIAANTEEEDQTVYLKVKPK